MPRGAGKRKKAKSHKTVDVSEAELKRTPRCFVVKKGRVGDRIRDLVKDFREVMMPNCAKALKESKINRIEDFVQVAGPLHVSHLVQFSATSLGTYMKLIRLPQGPTLTFKVNSFSLTRDIKASQRRPRQGERDFTSAPLQVLNGFSGNQAERQLTAEMVRGMFPAIDVPTFNHHECRRAVLFNQDKEKDVIYFRQYSVSRKQVGLNRGVSKMLRQTRVPKMSHVEDVADFVLSGGMGASDSEAEDAAEEAPNLGGGSNKVGMRLTEIGPRMELQLLKAEEGVCNGAVLYHRFQTRTPSQIEVLEAKARQRKKLKERNDKLEAQVEGKKAQKQKQEKKKKKIEDTAARAIEKEEPSDSEKEETGGGKKKEKKGGDGGGEGQGAQQGQKRKRFNPLYGDKKKKKGGGGGDGDNSVDVSSGRPAKAQKQGGGEKGGGKGNPRQKVLDRMRQSQRQ